MPETSNHNLQAKRLFYPEVSSQTSITNCKAIAHGVGYKVHIFASKWHMSFFIQMNIAIVQRNILLNNNKVINFC